jgi:hypothetical protein
MQSVVDEISQLLNHLIDFGWVFLEVLRSVQHQYSFGIVTLEPILVLDMNLFQILKRDLILLRPFSGHGSFVAFLRSASQINDFGLLLRSHRLETGVKALENFMLAFVHVPVVFHKLRKDVFVGENAPF